MIVLFLFYWLIESGEVFHWMDDEHKRAPKNDCL